uniref:Small ribosomal subunit protein uS17c n=1 Tax=Cyanidium caldarium TaxID=2771 RepID=RR17_CYACA|nr:ribosomal protein S17 [Cyanidium caldarium]Q9TLU1.1 RecName: Full=Small ribosomal subunit protein uS17c; AltName: Full=30S ribosomal protein S17, chloroplastic [Cyanidium caldarium]AAF12916.1 unknown [Cyanidium caldarium]WDB00303.1 ribosomal protein S17 [Cyanidium caldarium]
MSAKEIIGIVITKSLDKTAIVKTQSKSSHERYVKIIKKVKKYTVHDRENISRVGDKVIILQTRPLSKTKRWVIKSIL